jgi:hypothetical protein
LRELDNFFEMIHQAHVFEWHTLGRFHFERKKMVFYGGKINSHINPPFIGLSFFKIQREPLQP